MDTYPAGDPGAWLANRGDWSKVIPACIQCHGPGGIGVGADFPALAGQPAAYLQAQLTAWKAGQRPPGPQGLMGDIAARMDAQQISAAAAYFAQLPPTAAGQPSGTAANSEKAPISSAGAAPSPAERSSGAPPSGFAPPPADAIPDNEFGKVVRQGQDIFLRTGEHAGKFVGNSLNCVSCHMDAGRRKDASPMWAAYVMYPAYRSKNGHVNTLAERLQGCFAYSMNGAMPPADSETIVALESYMYWMAKGAPTGVKLEGQGFKRLPAAAQAPDYLRGQKVFQKNCVLCHGADGAGQKAQGKMVFPALWGDNSFNWGAGMHSVPTAAAFIKANMPLGGMDVLTDQEAWDVAYYMNAHERPQDPRYTGSLAETQQKYHDAQTDLYGQTVNGHVLGSAAPPPGGSLRK
ncbi:c-type cytochrome [Pollutimonas sp. M17]|uniref:c-type cytochrome n=1 Tax=Pollutimonas sp. M17 TaxID=2962065 RepID=UPI00398E6626